MIQGSPAPKIPAWRHRLSMGVALPIAGVAFVLTLLLAAFAYPLWADGWVRARAESAIQDRAKLERVAFKDFDLQRSHVVASELSLEGDGFSVQLGALDVEYDLSFAPRKVSILGVDVGSVRVDGDANALLRWAEERKAARGGVEGSATATTASRKFEFRPTHIRLKQGEVHLNAGELTQGLVAGVDAQFELELASGVLGFVATNIAIRDARGREFGAGSVTSSVALGSNFREPEFPVRVDVQGGFAELSRKVAVDGVSGHVELPDAGLEQFAVELRGGFSDRGAVPTDGEELWSLRGRGRRDLSVGEIRLEMAAFNLERVPRVLSQLPLVDSGDATVGGRLWLKLANGRIGIDGALALNGLNIEHPLLARDTVHDVGFELDLVASLDPARRHLDLERAELRRGKLRAVASGALTHSRDIATRHYVLDIKIPSMPCQALLTSIPNELIPSLEGIVLRGEYELDLHLDADFSNLDALELEGLKGSFGLARCVPKTVPARLSGTYLAGDFVHRVTMRDGDERELDLSFGSKDFTPLELISPAMPAAVLTTEDGGFWRHNGFLTSQFRNALKANLEAGRVRLGASTISMQLVKNLLLSHERTLSRKLQELFLTWYVELTLPKERMMELYLNIVEFGPGIYGITAAADHYFGKQPHEINSLEAAYLALMLPSPVRRHEHYCRGELSKKFDIKLRRIHRFMESREHIETWDYETYKDATLAFNPRDRGSVAHCLRESKRLLESTEEQLALTGLLGSLQSRSAMRSVRWFKVPPRERRFDIATETDVFNLIPPPSTVNTGERRGAETDVVGGVGGI